jgi:hypothetical protein
MLKGVFMDIPEKYRVPFSGWLGTEELSGSDLEYARAIETNFRNMSSETEYFVAAMLLCGFSKNNSDNECFKNWNILAANCGALAIHNYTIAFGKLRSLLGNVDRWNKILDGKQLKKIHTEFDKQFPHSKTLRDAVSHPEEYANKNKKMGVTESKILSEHMGFGYAIIRRSFLNNKFFCTFDGREAFYELGESNILFFVNNYKLVIQELKKISK